MHRRWATAIAALSAAALCWVLPAVPAVAKTPHGPRTIASAVIDANPGYVPQTRCTPSAKPGTTALLKLLIATWGGGSSGISRGCGVGGVSEHKEGRALDWHMDVKYASQRKRVGQATSWLTANHGEVARRLGVMYIIWNQHIWSTYYPELGWRKMASRGSYTANHKNHVHISLTWDGAYKQTSWWTGVPVTVPLTYKCGGSGRPACRPSIARSAKAWTSTTTVVPVPFLPAAGPEPRIGGSPQVGRTLTAVPGTWVADGATLAYQWRRNGHAIAGATASTYLVVAADKGKEIAVQVSATTASGTASKVSDGTADIYSGWFSAPKPTLAGTIAAGSTLSVNLGAWAPAPTTVRYAWLRDGKAIAKATAPTYAVKASDTGHRLAVRLTGSAAGYSSAVVTSAASKVGAAFTATPTPVITGTGQVGSVVSVDAGTWTPTPSSLRYAWYADGTAIAGATAASYSPTAEQVGRAVQVRVTALRSGYATTTVASVAVTVVAATSSAETSPDPTPGTVSAASASATPRP